MRGDRFLHDPAHIVGMLKAAGEDTRLRLLALLAQGELSVKDFTEILGQSQPRVSRHLKLLADSGLVSRHAEGAWAYYRLAGGGAGSGLVDWLVAALDRDAPEMRADRERLAALRAQRRREADAYFAKIAASWDRERALHGADAAVEEAVAGFARGRGVRVLLDLGTGTGRMLEVLAPHYRQGIGIDSSREMLGIARANLEAAGVGHAQVRLGDIADLSEHAGTADLVVLHQVLHYFDDPGRILIEAAGALAPGGAVAAVDFAPHELEFLRSEHAHRRLGLSPEQMDEWGRAAGLSSLDGRGFAAERGDGLALRLFILEKPH